jgi:hypothetical protein
MQRRSATSAHAANLLSPGSRRLARTRRARATRSRLERQFWCRRRRGRFGGRGSPTFSQRREPRSDRSVCAAERARLWRPLGPRPRSAPPVSAVLRALLLTALRSGGSSFVRTRPAHRIPGHRAHTQRCLPPTSRAEQELARRSA